MNEITQNRIEQAMDALFPHGAGRATYTAVRHQLETIAQAAFREGQTEALLGLMTSADVAEHFGVTERRARALIANRHERFGVGMQVGNQWLIHRSELDSLTPNGRYQSTPTPPPATGEQGGGEEGEE